MRLLVHEARIRVGMDGPKRGRLARRDMLRLTKLRHFRAPLGACASEPIVDGATETDFGSKFDVNSLDIHCIETPQRSEYIARGFIKVTGCGEDYLRSDG